jgi:alkylated DNA repair dioxygenase AlkB
MSNTNKDAQKFPDGFHFLPRYLDETAQIALTVEVGKLFEKAPLFEHRISEYVRYYHEDRTHLGLGKGMPDGRPRAMASGRVLSHVRLGGLHHRYDRAA